MNRPSLSQHNIVKSGAFLHLLVLLSGCAALSWEVVWQLKASLALGYSAWGTAITLAVTMGGMSAGALIMGQALRGRKSVKPVFIYGILEIIVGLCGLMLGTAFTKLEAIDTATYAASPDAAPVVYMLGIICILGLPALCLGATLPVIGLAAQKYKTSIALLYGLNTLGAAGGALLAAFLLIPALGITQTACTIATVNIIVGIIAILFGREAFNPPKPKTAKKSALSFSPQISALLVFVTGFSTFALEVAWFRSLKSAFQSTTDAFAIMLSCVLIALGLSARFIPALKKREAPLGLILAWAGILILLMTPVIERFDMVFLPRGDFPLLLIGKWFFMTLYTIGAPVFLIGVALPWILDEQDNPRSWGWLYGLNALAAIIGSIAAGWLLLPTIGFAKTAWLAGLLVAATGLVITPAAKRLPYAAFTIAALMIAFMFESGIGTKRIQAAMLTDNLQPTAVIKSFEGPDATISTVDTKAGHRMLVIDGFVATAQAKDYKGNFNPVHYMLWMGHLPMLAHPDPKNALVIAFGTGQTSNAVRNEKPESLDIVDLNKHVYDMAPYFTQNEGVLEDEIVNPIVMDGRAYIRRTQKTYDVITLEPMPPNFAGVNALYSKEFYEEARRKLSDDGVIAQWVPFHLVPPEYCAALARTFQSVFPNAVLWVDPVAPDGILLGSKNNDAEIGMRFPGFKRGGIKRDLSEREVTSAIALTPEQLKTYGSFGKIITDDNQLLAYGEAVYLSHRKTTDMMEDSRQLIIKAAGKAPKVMESSE